MISQLRRDLYGPIGEATMGCVLVVALLSLVCPMSATAKSPVRIKYGEASSRELTQIQRFLEKERWLEVLAQNNEKYLTQLPPETLTLTTAQCGKRKKDFFYTPDTKTITMCYEVIQFLIKEAEKDYGRSSDSGWLVIGAMSFLFNHELGHAFIDLYNIPAYARDEDIADQFALLSLETQSPEQAQRYLSGALWFFRKNEEGGFSEEILRDEHSMSRQRYYHIMCWAYGKDSSRYGSYEDKLQDRAPRCKDEYERGLASFRAVWQQGIQRRNPEDNGLALQQTTGSSTFQVLVNQLYTHPSDPMLKFGFDGQMVLVMYEKVPIPLAMLQLASFPDGQWIPLQSIDQRQLPIRILRRGLNLMAQWTQ